MPEACPCRQQLALSGVLAKCMLQPPSAVCCKVADITGYGMLTSKGLWTVWYTVVAFQQVLRFAWRKW